MLYKYWRSNSQRPSITMSACCAHQACIRTHNSSRPWSERTSHRGGMPRPQPNLYRLQSPKGKQAKPGLTITSPSFFGHFWGFTKQKLALLHSPKVVPRHSTAAYFENLLEFAGPFASFRKQVTRKCVLRAVGIAPKQHCSKNDRNCSGLGCIQL